MSNCSARIIHSALPCRPPSHRHCFFPICPALSPIVVSSKSYFCSLNPPVYLCLLPGLRSRALPLKPPCDTHTNLISSPLAFHHFSLITGANCNDSFMLFFCPHLSPLLQWISFMWKNFLTLYIVISWKNSLISDHLLVCRHLLFFPFMHEKERETPGGKQLSFVKAFFCCFFFFRWVWICVVLGCKFIWPGLGWFGLVAKSGPVCALISRKFFYKLTQKQQPESTCTLSIPDTDWACR